MNNENVSSPGNQDPWNHRNYQNAIDWMIRGRVCPEYNDPPVSKDEDLKFICRFWDICDHEEECLEREQCPIIHTDKPRLGHQTRSRQGDDPDNIETAY